MSSKITPFPPLSPTPSLYCCITMEKAGSAPPVGATA